MKSKKIISLISALTLTASLLFAFPVGVYATDQNTSGTVPIGTQDISTDHFVEGKASTTLNAIHYGRLDVSGKRAGSHTEGTDQGQKDYIVYSSGFDIAGGEKYIQFGEGATNTNAVYTVTSSGVPFKGLNNEDWMLLRNKSSGDNKYVSPVIQGQIAADIYNLTPPSGGTIIGSFKVDVKSFDITSSTVLTTNIIPVYVALVNTGTQQLYVGTSTNLAENSIVYSNKDESKSPAFYGGNKLILTQMPSGTDSQEHATTSLKFGYEMTWNEIQNDANMEFLSAIDIPVLAASGNPWTWNLSIVGEYTSEPT